MHGVKGLLKPFCCVVFCRPTSFSCNTGMCVFVLYETREEHRYINIAFCPVVRFGYSLRCTKKLLSPPKTKTKFLWVWCKVKFSLKPEHCVLKAHKGNVGYTPCFPNLHTRHSIDHFTMEYEPALLIK
jgi:hypothetical protein